MKLLRLGFLFFFFHCTCGRGGRGRGRSRGGGFDGVDPSLLDPWSFLPSTHSLDMLTRNREIEERFRTIKDRRKETNYGTNVKINSVSNIQFNAQIENVSQKAFGLGVGPSFIGGAGMGLWEPNFGFVAGLVSFSVYHRYVLFKKLLHQLDHGHQWNETQYYESYYEKNVCIGGCPAHSHCEWGICECDTLEGYHQMWGRCIKDIKRSPGKDNYAPFVPCIDSYTCLSIDKNLICSNQTGKCTCRRDMKWREQIMECQIYIDVDCSTVTYARPPSSAVLDALERNPSKIYVHGYSRSRELVDAIVNRKGEAKKDPTAARELAKDEKNCNWPHGKSVPTRRTESKEENSCTCLLSYIERNQKKDLVEAFCRDIDAYSVVFQVKETSGPQPCPKIPTTSCAVVYDSHDCSGGWSLQIKRGEQRRFRYFSSDWKYRNDIDTVGVRSGCTFTGFSGSSFDGSRFSLTAGLTDRWVVLGEDSQYNHMDQNIESLQCICRGL